MEVRCVIRAGLWCERVATCVMMTCVLLQGFLRPQVCYYSKSQLCNDDDDDDDITVSLRCVFKVRCVIILSPRCVFQIRCY